MLYRNILRNLPGLRPKTRLSSCLFENWMLNNWVHSTYNQYVEFKKIIYNLFFFRDVKFSRDEPHSVGACYIKRQKYCLFKMSMIIEWIPISNFSQWNIDKYCIFKYPWVDMFNNIYIYTRHNLITMYIIKSSPIWKCLF